MGERVEASLNQNADIVGLGGLRICWSADGGRGMESLCPPEILYPPPGFGLPFVRGPGSAEYAHLLREFYAPILARAPERSLVGAGPIARKLASRGPASALEKSHSRISGNVCPGRSFRGQCGVGNGLRHVCYCSFRSITVFRLSRRKPPDGGRTTSIVLLSQAAWEHQLL